MLDIYYIEDQTKDIPDEPDEKKYLGSVDLHQHKSLEVIFNKCASRNISFPYFEDSLIKHEHAEEMMRIFKKSSHLIVDDDTGKEAYKLVVDILSKVVQKGAGLVCFSD